MLVLAHMATLCVTLGWTVSALALQLARVTGRQTPKPAKVIFHELRPFFVAAAVTQFLISVWLDGHLPWGLVTFVFNLINWRNLKDEGGGDDRWKRRRQKLSERVQAVGGRLAVVPAGA